MKWILVALCFKQFLGEYLYRRDICPKRLEHQRKKNNRR